MSKPEEEKKISRRTYLQVAGGTIVGLAVGGALGYLAKPTEVTTLTSTSTLTQTVTVTGTAPPPTTPASPWKKLEGKYKGMTLRGIMFQSPGQGSLTDFMKEFSEISGAEVIYDTSYGEDAVIEKELLDFSQRTGLNDFSVAQWWWTTDFAEKGYVEPLDDYIAGKVEGTIGGFDIDSFVYPGPQELFYWKGHIYALPFYHQEGGLACYKPLFEKYKVQYPKTFDEIFKAAEKLTDRSIGQYGFTTRILPSFVGFYDVAGWLYAYGGPILDENMNLRLATPEHIRGLTEMVTNLKKYSVPGAANFGWVEQAKAYTTGNIGVMLDYDLNGPVQAVMVDPAVKGKTYTTLQPEGPYSRYSVVYDMGWWINAHIPQEKKKAVWDMFVYVYTRLKDLRYLVEKYDVQELCHLVYKEHYTSPDYEKLMAEQGYEQFYKAVRAEIKYSKPEHFPRLPEFKSVGQIVATHVSNAVAELETPEEALTKAEKELQPIIDDLKARGFTKYWYNTWQDHRKPDTIFYYPGLEDVEKAMKEFGPGTVLEPDA